jgi:UDP-glucuronate 4-epimerase
VADKFLIIGALGCIGAWTAKRLISEGSGVVAFDLPGDPHRLRLIMTGREIDEIAFVEGDVADQVALERTVRENGITHIVHLAALQVPSVRAKPVLGMTINVVGTTIVFEVAKAFADQVQSVVYASSVAVYGPASAYPPGPIAHDAPFLPTTLYGVSKVANEQEAKVYWQDYGIRSVGVRPAFVYGPARDVGMTSTPTKAMLIQAAHTMVDGAPCFNLGGTRVTMADVVDAITAAAPESAGTITSESNQLPFPDEYDGHPLDKAVGPIGWRAFADGTRETIELFKEAIADDRIDVDRAIA